MYLTELKYIFKLLASNTTTIWICSKKEILEELISSCHYLQKLSLAGLHASKPYFEPSILLNNQSLKVLDLNGCKGLSLDSIKTVVLNCLELTEVNFDNTKLDTESIEFLCTNLTCKIEKLSLFRLKVTDEDVKVLVQNCKKISELDLGSTAVTEISKQFLRCLQLYYFPTDKT